MQMGKNTVSSDKLRVFVERLENIDSGKKQLTLDRSAIMGEAKSEGFTPAAINYVVRVRKQKPHDRQEAEAMRDMYLHAMGMAAEPPLFRYASMAAIDVSVREQVVERMRDFVPGHGDGHIDVQFGADTIRLVRAKDGSVSDEIVTPVVREAKNTATVVTGTPSEPVPDVDEAGARGLGAEYARDNKAVIDNPFPFGDKRRAAFDEGWRKENGGDGMGPDDGKGGK